MPTPGTFILHSRAVPPLGAGDYSLQGTQEVAGGATDPYTGHLRVTSARYRMPPDQILSSYPPANAEGAFESRLPQVVIRRRTLPWERVMDDAHREIPWMALVVIAEGEGQISGETPVKDCVTPGVTLSGPNDVASGVYLAVSETVVKSVFPTKDDLQLLVHVREVDLNDTELALGDDDGFLAVILANRLPQYDRVNCKPVRYMACLINLEGQLDVLPTPADSAAFDFSAVEVVQDIRLLVEGMSLSADQYIMGTRVNPAPVPGPGLAAGTMPDAAAAVTASSAGAQTTFTASLSAATTAQTGIIAESWKTTQTSVNDIAASATPAEAGRLVRDAMTSGFRFPVELLVSEKVFRFPVLAHWSFTCTGAGSFQSLMQGLDVGLLGTLPADPTARPKPDCAPPPKGDAPPPTEPPRPNPECTETGHVGLHHLTRRGDSLRAWYRGPLTLHVTERAQPADGRLPLAHTSDQLRRVTPDGREDVALAAAFEIGRLLAFSQPSVVSALMRWRAEQFGAERARRLGRVALGSLTMLGPALKGSIFDLGQLTGKQMVLAAAQAPERALAPNRPLADPGRPLAYLTGDVDQIIADGFGFSLEAVRKLASTAGAAAALNSVAVPQATAATFDRAAGVQLRASLSSVVDELTEGAISRAGLSGTPLGASLAIAESRRDALDELLDAAAKSRQEKP
jgi:hypothetical protein